MLVIYRICPYPSGKSLISDKFELVKICLRSFLKAFEGCQVRIVFILDSCPEIYHELIKREVVFPKKILSAMNAGNLGTFHKQLKIASETEEKVLLQEDDYFYLEKSGEKMIKALDALEIVSPYDHPDYYTEEHHKGAKPRVDIDGQIWQKVNSTCLTFAAKGDTFKKYLAVMLSYGTADHPMFMKLKELGACLYAPVPTLATHTELKYLAPGIKENYAFRSNFEAAMRQ